MAPIADVFNQYQEGNNYQEIFEKLLPFVDKGALLGGEMGGCTWNAVAAASPHQRVAACSKEVGSDSAPLVEDLCLCCVASTK